MNKRVKNVLKNYGLDDKEIALYLAALEMGASNMTAIAKRAKLKRPTAYLIYESLEKKGLMGSFKTSWGLSFFAKDPSILEQKTIQVMNDIKDIVPELQAIENQNIKKPKIMYYEGVENYKEIVEDTLRTSNETIYIIGSLDPIVKILGKKYDEEYYIPKRISQNISVKAMLSSETQEFPSREGDAEKKREVRYLPEGKEIKSLIIIYGDKVVSINADKDIFMTVTESPVLAQDEKVKFDLIWDSLKK